MHRARRAAQHGDVRPRTTRPPRRLPRPDRSAYRDLRADCGVGSVWSMGQVRACRADERETMLAIINAAAEAYRGVIPDDCFHDPYMAADELDREIAAGVAFWGYEDEERLVGLMGIQTVDDVELIRHAYVEPEQQGRGVGTELLEHLVGM